MSKDFKLSKESACPIIQRISSPKESVLSLIDLDSKEYDLQEMSELKEKLNKAKSRMDDYYDNPKTKKDFAFFANKTRITQTLRRELTERFNAQHATRAWIKFYELYQIFNLIPTVLAPPTTKGVRAFLNAELPGSSILALNHLMKTIYEGTPFEWMASSFVEEGSSILGDMFGVWGYNKNHWLMSSANDGDMTKASNILNYEELLQHSINIYTHDAGISVSGKDPQGRLLFNLQEELNAKLHFGCALAGLITMNEGACSIWKQYTAFEAITQSLMVIYASLFDEFYLVKPITSGCSNSEIYLVGVRFKGISAELREILLAKLTSWSMRPLIPRGKLPREIMGEIAHFVAKRVDHQIACIEAMLDNYREFRKNPKFLAKMKEEEREFAKNWLQKYKIEKITRANYIKANEN